MHGIQPLNLSTSAGPMLTKIEGADAPSEVLPVALVGGRSFLAQILIIQDVNCGRHACEDLQRYRPIHPILQPSRSHGK